MSLLRVTGKEDGFSVELTSEYFLGFSLGCSIR